MLLVELQEVIIVVITYPICSRVALKNQASMPVYQDFWYQELSNQIQPDYAT